MRSLLPTDTKSTRGRSSSSSNSTLGTSIMAPIRSLPGFAHPRLTARSRSLSISTLISSISVATDTMGIMTRNSRPAAARSIARICMRNSAGRSSDMRTARHPMAGFSSGTCGR